MDFRLGYELRLVERYVRAIRIHRSGALVWGVVALAAAAVLAWPVITSSVIPYSAELIVLAVTIAALTAAWVAWRDRTQLLEAARAVERAHPELGSSLRAAIEQQPDAEGRFHFLQRRVIADALQHAGTTDWVRPVRRRARIVLAAHIVAVSSALVLSALVVRQRGFTARAPNAASDRAAGVEVTPGDVELERGSSVVIAGRFGGRLPRQVVLVWQPIDGAAVRQVMHQSLADPVFAVTLPVVASDGVYHLEHDGESTTSYRVTVFDLPALLRADATLDYPDYTGLPDRTITDTRRISAVVGTALDYTFVVNQPLSSAVLRGAEVEVPLAAADTSKTRFHLRSRIESSQRYTLHLVDTAGRTNAAPTEIRIEALENRPPELKLTFPRGDQRVSPIQELRLEGEARDDFGLRDYGLAYSVGAEPPHYRSLAGSTESPGVQAVLHHVLALEEHAAKPDQLVTWFAWADDVGPDGELRRTTSDLLFAEVRALDEIFRENATGGRQPMSGAGGGEGEELIELQRQLSVAIWKLRARDPLSSAFAADASTLHQGQVEVHRQLAAIRERLPDARTRTAADEAATFMERAAAELVAAGENRRVQPLDSAWTASQGAYQALLRMQPRETEVAQSRDANTAGNGRRNQNQLNQLQFRNEEDRYATETQAQPPPTPQEREQLQVLARLRELARRQQDLNERLQDLQTALAAAEDEAQREQIRRELKRLEDEQRRMVADLDETRQRLDRLQPGQRTHEARQQLERTRQDMRRATEQLAEGEVSQALAAGTRARENLQRTSEEFRRDAAGRFGEQMREARRQARELAAGQQEATRELHEMNRGRQSLDDATQREEIARQLEAQSARRQQLLDTLRQVAEDSEASEPQLHRQLYDLLRQQGRDGSDQQLASGAELLRRGFVQPVAESQVEVAQAFDQLQRSVERAASAVLGDEASELRFVQRELEDLARELQRDRDASSTAATGTNDAPPSGDPAAVRDLAANPRDPNPALDGPSDTSSSGQGASAGASSEQQLSQGVRPGAGSPAPTDEALASLEQFAREFGEGGRGGGATRGPLTGADFGGWVERLRTVEELLEEPALRQQLAQARFQAEELRREFQRHSRRPRWDLVQQSVVNPLQDARTWVRRELSRVEQPDTLQPVDRDPVPERYAESVRKYYEALGAD
jgi:hypothetical protein